MQQTNDHLSARLRRFLLLNMLATIGHSCYILADTFFISIAEGANGITALNLVLPVYSLIYAIGAMIGTGSATRFSILRAGGRKDADVYFSNAVFFAVLAGIPFILAGLFCPETVLRVLGADAAITAVGKSYTSIFMSFAPFFMLNYVFISFIRNDNAPAFSMAGTLISSFANILLDYLFMFPLKMGMAGAALATALSPIISICVCSLHFFTKANTLHFRFALPSVRKLFRSCQLGVASFVGEISSGITTAVFNFLLLRLVGNIGVAAYGVTANLALVGTAIFNGIAQGLQPLASEAHGKNDRAAKNLILRQSMITAGFVSAAAVILVMLLADPLVALFNTEHSAAMAAHAVPGIRLYFLGFLFAAFNITGTGYLNATAHAKSSFLIALLRGLIAITGYAFLLSALLGVNGVWLAFAASELTSLIVTAAALRRARNE